MKKIFLSAILPLILGSCGFEKNSQDDLSVTKNGCTSDISYGMENGMCYAYKQWTNPATGQCERSNGSPSPGSCGESQPPPPPPPPPPTWNPPPPPPPPTWNPPPRPPPPPPPPTWNPPPRPPPPPPPRPRCDDTDYRIEGNSCIRYDEVYNSSFNSCRWERFGQVSDSNCGIHRPTCSGFDYRWSSNRCERYENVYNSSSNSCRWEYDAIVSDSQCGVTRPTCSGFDYRWTSNRCERYENVYNSSSNSCRWEYDSIVSDSQCGVNPPPRPTPRPTPWPTPDPDPWPTPDPDPWPTPWPTPRPTPRPPTTEPGPMVNVTVMNATLVKALPVQSATLRPAQKCNVSAGMRFTGRVLRYAEGNHIKFAVTSGLNHCRDLLAANNGSIFIYLPHVSF